MPGLMENLQDIFVDMVRINILPEFNYTLSTKNVGEYNCDGSLINDQEVDLLLTYRRDYQLILRCDEDVRG